MKIINRLIFTFFLFSITPLLASETKFDFLNSQYFNDQQDVSEHTTKDYSYNVIYGDDDRRDLYEINDPQIIALARSTAALVRDKYLSPTTNDDFIYTAISLGERLNNLCKDEPYYNQPSGAKCSGFLVAPDILATAGHCVRSAKSCKGFKVVFDLSVNEKQIFPTKIKKQNTYSCKKVIVHSTKRDNDYALLKLDRPVLERTPLKIRRSGAIEDNTSLLVIGHPAGLPTKISDGAKVFKSSSTSFTAGLDTYGGNSGSPVFNANTNEVEGILSRGAKDFQYDRRKNCSTSNRCKRLDPASSSSCLGEESTKITQLTSFIPQL